MIHKVLDQNRYKNTNAHNLYLLINQILSFNFLQDFLLIQVRLQEPDIGVLLHQLVDLKQTIG